MYYVVFIVRETGAKVTKAFDSEYRYSDFLRKLKYSKKLILVAHYKDF